MILKIILDENAHMPFRAHRWDAGLDLCSTVDGTIPGGDWRTFSTGVHIQIPAGFVGFIKSRSGMMSNHGITTDGTIDSGYTGPIKVTLINNSMTPYRVNAGDKIAQLVILPCALPELALVEQFEATDRGNNGFGSTGR